MTQLARMWGVVLPKGARLWDPVPETKRGEPRPSARPSPRAGVVYFLAAVGHGTIKIGFTGQTLANRINAIRTMSPVPVDVVAFFPGTTQDERSLHAIFAAHRMHGEWFALEPVVQWLGSFRCEAAAPHFSSYVAAARAEDVLS